MQCTCIKISGKFKTYLQALLLSSSRLSRSLDLLCYFRELRLCFIDNTIIVILTVVFQTDEDNFPQLSDTLAVSNDDTILLVHKLNLYVHRLSGIIRDGIHGNGTGKDSLGKTQALSCYSNSAPDTVPCVQRSSSASHSQNDIVTISLSEDHARVLLILLENWLLGGFPMAASEGAGCACVGKALDQWQRVSAGGEFNLNINFCNGLSLRPSSAALLPAIEPEARSERYWDPDKEYLLAERSRLRSALRDITRRHQILQEKTRTLQRAFHQSQRTADTLRTYYLEEQERNAAAGDSFLVRSWGYMALGLLLHVAVTKCLNRLL